MKKITALRFLWDSKQRMLPLIGRLYELQEIEHTDIVYYKKTKIVAGVLGFGSHYEYIWMFGAKRSEPHLHLIRELKEKEDGEKRKFILTHFGLAIGKAYYEGRGEEAGKMLFARHIQMIPQLRAVVHLMMKPEAVEERGRRKFYGKNDKDRLLQDKIKEYLRLEGLEATCNVVTLEHILRFLMGYGLVTREKKAKGRWRYELDVSLLRTKYPKAWETLEPLKASLDALPKIIWDAYQKIASGQQVFVPVAMLRDLVLDKIGWTRYVFDTVLAEIERANPETVITHAGPVTLVGEPLLGDPSKALIKIKGHYIYLPKQRLLERLRRWKRFL